MNRRDEMLRLRFEEYKSLKEIGQEFGVTRERVRQIIGNTGRLLDQLLVERNNAIKESTETTPALAEKYGLTVSHISTIRDNHHRIIGGSCQKGERAERFINQKLTELGIENELMPTGHAFDILAFDSVKIDVKGAFKTSCTGGQISPQWHFSIGKNVRGSYCDVFICVIWNTKDCFIIPDNMLKENQTDIFFCYPTKRPKIGKYQKYLNRWDLIG